MGYVDKVLEPGEQIAYRGRISTVSFVPGAAILIAGLVIVVVAPVMNPVIAYVGAVIAVLGLLELARAWIRRAFTEMAVTDRRVIIKRGVISRRTLEMNLTRIESVDVQQGIVGRLLNFGDIVIRGTGSGMEPLRGIDSPIEFRRRVLA